MNFDFVHQKTINTKINKKEKKNLKEDNYKGIFHRDHLPATIGMFGFIICFSLMSLQIGISPFVGKAEKELEVMVEEEDLHPLATISGPTTGKVGDNLVYEIKAYDEMAKLVKVEVALGEKNEVESWDESKSNPWKSLTGGNMALTKTFAETASYSFEYTLPSLSVGQYYVHINAYKTNDGTGTAYCSGNPMCTGWGIEGDEAGSTSNCWGYQNCDDGDNDWVLVTINEANSNECTVVTDKIVCDAKKVGNLWCVWTNDGCQLPEETKCSEITTSTTCDGANKPGCAWTGTENYGDYCIDTNQINGCDQITQFASCYYYSKELGRGVCVWKGKTGRLGNYCVSPDQASCEEIVNKWSCEDDKPGCAWTGTENYGDYCKSEENYSEYDLNEDGNVNKTDLVLFISNYFSPGSANKSIDFDEDGMVDLNDYKLLKDNFN